VKKLLFLLIPLLASSSYAERLKTVFNSQTGKQDYITKMDTGTIVAGNNVSVSCTSSGACTINASTSSTNNLAPGSTNYINVTETLQSGATFYVSSGTVAGLLRIATATVNGQLNVGGPIAGNGAYLQNVPIMSPSLTAPFPGATAGYLDITQYYNTATGATGGFRVAGVQTLSRQGGMIVVGNAGSGVAASNGICIGDSSCSNIDAGGLRSTVIGSVAGQADMAEDNTCIGYNTCAANLTNRQTLIGAFAGASLTTGPSNTAIGWDTMPLATTADANVCIGSNACDLLTTGSENMVVGNTAGADITIGVRNVCMGGGTGAVQSCTGIITGSSNTAVGNGSLGNISYTGAESANTTIGYKAAVGIGVNNAVAIGYNSVATSSYTMMLGGIGNDGVRVIMTTMTVSSGTVSGQLSVGSIKFADGTVQITSAPASGSGSGMTAGATYYIQVRDTLQTGATFYVSSGTIQNELNVGDGVHDGHATVSRGSDIYELVGSSVAATAGLCAVASSSTTVIWATCGTGGAGSGSGTINAASQFSLPYYSLQGSTTQLSGYPNVSLSTTTAITISTGTTFTSSITITNIGNLNLNSGVGILAAQGVQTSTLQITGLLSKTCIGTDGSGNVQAGTCGGGGGSSTLAVANNIVTYTGPNISSPTAIINADTATMLVELTGSATAFLSLKSSSVTLQGNTLGGDVTGTLGAMVVGDDSHNHTGATISGLDISADTNLAATQPVVLTNDTLGLTLISLSTGVVGTLPVGNGGTGLTSAQSAVQPIVYNSGTGVFGATLISLSTGVVGTLGVANGGTGLTSAQTATQPIVYNSATGVFGATPISLSTGIIGVLPAANFPAQVPFSVLPTTIAYITSTQTFTGSNTFWGPITHNTSSTTFNAAIQVSTSILLSGAVGVNGQVLTSGGPGAIPSWTTPTGGSGYATIQDEASNLTQRTTVNFTGSGVSCADNAGSSRTDCTINAGAATAGGVKGNVQYNDGSALQGAGGFNIWTSSVVISTGGVGGYETYVATLNVISSFTLTGVSTMTSTVQWDQRAAFTFTGKQGLTDQIVMSSGSAVAPKWGPIYGVVRTTSDYTTPTGTTLNNIPNLDYNLVANSTYSVTCNLVFQTTATVLGARLSMSLTAGSTIAATIEIPMAADGTAGALQGWVTMSGDPVTGTAVQAANTNYIGNIDGMIFVGSSGATANAMAGGEVTNGSTVIKAGSMCVYNGVSP